MWSQQAVVMFQSSCYLYIYLFFKSTHSDNDLWKFFSELNVHVLTQVEILSVRDLSIHLEDRRPSEKEHFSGLWREQKRTLFRKATVLWKWTSILTCPFNQNRQSPQMSKASQSNCEAGIQCYISNTSVLEDAELIKLKVCMDNYYGSRTVGDI